MHLYSCCLHLVQNAVATQVVYAFQIDKLKKAIEARTKKSLWCSRKIIFRTKVSLTGCHALLFSAVFRALQQAQQGLTAGWLTCQE